jgi:hypothetical protein
MRPIFGTDVRPAQHRINPVASLTMPPSDVHDGLLEVLPALQSVLQLHEFSPAPHRPSLPHFVQTKPPFCVAIHMPSAADMARMTETKPSQQRCPGGGIARPTPPSGMHADGVSATEADDDLDDFCVFLTGQVIAQSTEGALASATPSAAARAAKEILPGHEVLLGT